MIGGALTWYVIRSSGLVAWALLAGSVFWGVALSSRFLGPRPKPNWMLDLHRFLSALAVVFTLVHLGALALDGAVPAGPIELLVPFSYPQHPAVVAWGVVAWYLLMAVEVTSLLRRRLSRRAWRVVHTTSFVLFALATVHLLGAGTDRRVALLRLLVMAVSIGIAAVTVVRLVMADEREQRATAGSLDARPSVAQSGSRETLT